MKIEIHWSDKIRAIPSQRPFADFAQKMANRLIVGFLRYGPPRKEQNYMTRLIMETKAYKRTGNAEHLYNIANYCLLETITPENKKFCFDPTVESATRNK